MSYSAELDRRQTLRRSFLDALGPELEALLRDPTLTDLAINPDGRVWIERLGEPMRNAGITRPAAMTRALIKTAASIVGTTYEREPRLLELVLEEWGWRFEGVLPPSAPGPTVAIRKSASLVMPLRKLVEKGTLSEQAAAVLSQAVKDRQSILIVGGTGAGKTTFANSLNDEIARIHPDDRIITIEDQPELVVAVENRVPLFTAWDTTMTDLVRASLRLYPKRILVGETRGAEALDLIKAWNTGHPGGLATCHANGALEGLMRLEQLAAEGTHGFIPRSEVAAAVNMVVFIAKRGVERRVEQVLAVRGLDAAGNYKWEEVSK